MIYYNDHRREEFRGTRPARSSHRAAVGFCNHPSPASRAEDASAGRYTLFDCGQVSRPAWIQVGEGVFGSVITDKQAHQVLSTGMTARCSLLGNGRFNSCLGMVFHRGQCSKVAIRSPKPDGWVRFPGFLLQSVTDSQRTSGIKEAHYEAVIVEIASASIGRQAGRRLYGSRRHVAAVDLSVGRRLFERSK